MRKLLTIILTLALTISTPISMAESIIDTLSVSLPETQVNTFSIRSNDAGSVNYDAQTNTYTITSAGEYTCKGELYEGQLRVAAGDAEVAIDLSGCLLMSSTAAPIYAESAGEAKLSAIKGTENCVYDLRPSVDSEETTAPAAIFATCDLTVKGNGALEVVSTAHKGIRSKDDLTVRNLTLLVRSAEEALQGSDSVTIESGNIVAISTTSSAVKTTATDANKRGEMRGTVSVLGGNVKLYAGHNGINSASDAIISGNAVVEIYTDEYSPYVGSGSGAAASTLYLRLDQALSSAGYRYSAYFFKADQETGQGKWVDLEQRSKTSTTPNQNDNHGSKGGKGGFGGDFDGGFGGDFGGHGDFGGGRGGKGGGFGGSFGGASYTYFEVKRPSGYDYVRFYAYAEGQEPGQAEDFAAVTQEDAAIPTSLDTLILSGVSGSELVASGWTSYAASTGDTGPAYSCKGIKAGNQVEITGGTVTIHAKDDGIHANFDTVMEATGVSGLGHVHISGGTITISSDDDGIHADQDLLIDGGSVTVLQSYEGLEANCIYISDGSVTVNARDDAINAHSHGAYAAYLEISGGTVDATVPGGDTDTLDSNGTILISGGYVFLKNGSTSGSSFAGGTVDSERGVSVTGGTVIAMGCIGDRLSDAVMSTAITFPGGDYVIADADGGTIASFTLLTPYRGCMLYSDQFVSDHSYTITCNGETAASFQY